MSVFEIYFVGVSFIHLLCIFGTTTSIGLLMQFTLASLIENLIEKKKKTLFELE